MNNCKTSSRRLEALDAYMTPDLFKALCDETRLAILVRLACASSPLTVSEAASCCGVHLSGVSRHLKLLKDAGLVEAERHGREVRYQARCAELADALRKLADALDNCCGGNNIDIPYFSDMEEKS